MPSKDLSTYPDVKAVLDAAIDRGGIAYRAHDTHNRPSKGAATHFLQRIAAFRRLYRLAHGTRYDEMTIRRRCSCPASKNTCHEPGLCTGHIIDILPGLDTLLRGQVTDLEGREVELTIRPVETPAITEVDLAADEAARQIAEDLEE